MAGPLIVCPSCSNHVLVRDAACPHCGATVRSGGKVLGRTASAVLMGLALAGCPADDDNNDTMASSGSSGDPSTTTDPTNGSTTEDPTDPTAMTTSALYGGPVTGEPTSTTTDSTSTGGDTESDTEGTTGTGGGSTSISPDYGVPTTTGE